MTNFSLENPEERKKVWQSGYRAALVEIETKLNDCRRRSNLDVDTWWWKLYDRLKDRSLSACSAGQIGEIFGNVLMEMSWDIQALKDRNQKLAEENYMFSNSLLGLQERFNAEKTPGKNHGSS